MFSPRCLSLALAILLGAGLSGVDALFAQTPPAPGFQALPGQVPLPVDGPPFDPFAVAPTNSVSYQLPPMPSSTFPADRSPEWEWTFLPQGFLYHTYWASTAEPRLSTRSIDDWGGNNSLDSQIGGRVGLLRFGDPDAEEGFQLDILGGANLRQNVDTYDWDMTGTDYRYDIPLTYRNGRHAWKFGYYHVSSHMGDEFLKYNPSVSRIDYYRDSLYLGYSHYVTPELRLYGEIDYAFRSDFAEPLHLQFGFDWGPVRPTGALGAPFLAANVHLREELDFSGNISVQAGWAWKGEGLGAGTLRTGLHYYNGGSPQFSFYQESEQQIGWGIWYDY
ncbi:DUF1207 domain-containing protein [Bremerella sp. T1]|uniref:DUF1207 domain-containing protein n=1 Tax=Bremerella sp. TYQ1 TaxID=3119568 RepID=UPI001CCE936B|nr:DUF1207 domain-containing protein [Bremerella volcania]UBM35344.1 DUF1207 domain-containing protein [Bremerella volcania]